MNDVTQDLPRDPGMYTFMLKIFLKICSDQGHLLANCGTEREKFYPGPGPEPGLLAFRANALTN